MTTFGKLRDVISECHYLLGNLISASSGGVIGTRHAERDSAPYRVLVFEADLNPQNQGTYVAEQARRRT